MDTLLDRTSSVKAGSGEEEHAHWKPPASIFEAVKRGIRNRCPSCGVARFFPRFLKPIEICPVCQKDWTAHRADDFPAYLSILLTGHLVAPIIIALASSDRLPLWAIAAILVVLVLVLCISLLQPAKGAIMALLWRWGVNGSG